MRRYTKYMNNKTQVEYNRYKNRQQNKTVKGRTLRGFFNQYAAGPLWRPKKVWNMLKNIKKTFSGEITIKKNKADGQYLDANI